MDWPDQACVWLKKQPGKTGGARNLKTSPPIWRKLANGEGIAYKSRVGDPFCGGIKVDLAFHDLDDLLKQSVEYLHPNPPSKKHGIVPGRLYDLGRGWAVHTHLRLLQRFVKETSFPRNTGNLIKIVAFKGKSNSLLEKEAVCFTNAHEVEPADEADDEADEGNDTKRQRTEEIRKDVVGKVVPEPPKPLSRGDQLDSACAMNVELVSYARKTFGNKPGGMSTKFVKKWYKEDMANRLPERFKGRVFGSGSDDLQVCHIISKAKGGHDFVYNYFIDTARVNRYFSKFMPREWDFYIGKDAYRSAETFAQWVALRSKAVITFGSFDPIADFYTARG